MEAIVGVPLLIIGLFILLILSILIMILPTFINILISALFSYFCYKKLGINKYLSIFVFIFISMVIGLNFRIPILFDIFLQKDAEVNIIKSIEKSKIDSIRISTDIEEIVFKEKPLSTIGVGGNEGCMCLYYTYPKNRKANIKNTILSYGIPVNFNQESGYTIYIKNESDSSLIYDLSIKIYNNDKLLSSARKKFIKSYFVENKVSTRERSDNILKFSLYLLQNNIWNYLLGIFPPFNEQKDLLDEIITKTFKESDSKESYAKTINATLEEISNFEKIDAFYISPGKSGDIVADDSNLVKETFQVYSFTIDNIIYPITPQIAWHNVEKVLKLDNEIFFIKTGAKEIVVEKYNLKGKLIQIFKLSLPEMSWQGYPRKPLIYFKKITNGYQFGLLEFGENIKPKEHYFYFFASGNNMVKYLQ